MVQTRCKVIGVVERKQFPSLVMEILRTHIYPTVSENDEETCPCAIEANQGFVRPVCGGHCCNRECDHKGGAVRDVVEVDAASEVDAEERCKNNYHSGDQETQTPMPLSEIPNGIGPPPPDSLTATQGMSHRHFLQILFFAPYTETLFLVVWSCLLQVQHCTSIGHELWTTTISPTGSKFEGSRELFNGA